MEIVLVRRNGSDNFPNYGISRDDLTFAYVYDFIT